MGDTLIRRTSARRPFRPFLAFCDVPPFLVRDYVVTIGGVWGYVATNHIGGRSLRFVSMPIDKAQGKKIASSRRRRRPTVLIARIPLEVLTPRQVEYILSGIMFGLLLARGR
jgi:hypothetical protein